jgi:putative phage-type endonuclease
METLNTDNTTLGEFYRYLIHEYIRLHPHAIADPDFDLNMEHHILEFTNATINHVVEDNDVASVYKSQCDIYFEEHPRRQYEDDSDVLLSSTLKSFISPSTDCIEAVIEKLHNKFQPEQRTTEWYQYRHGLITASNAYKAFESDAVKNQLIYEKCQPIQQPDNTLTDEIKMVRMVNTTTTLHWGQKYEPVSVMIYEQLFNTHISEYGCMQHDIYSFIGASPDGINTKKDSDKFGRLLEVKNIVNREINGIPKKEYWVQMQLQMEVCNINACDFLETRFTEYKDEPTFENDRLSEDDESYFTSADGKMKGALIHFHKPDGSPKYIYKPLNICTKTTYDKWCREIVTDYEQNQGVVFIVSYYFSAPRS